MSIAAAKEKLGEAAKMIGVAKEVFADSPEKQKRVNSALRDIAKALKRRNNPDQGRAGVQQVIKMLGLSPRDGNQLIDKLNDMVKKGEMPKHLALESNQPEWGTPEATKKAKKKTPGEKV